MANHASAKKRNRQTEKKQARNYAQRSQVRAAERKMRQAIDAKDEGVIKDMLPKTIAEIMKARSNGILHRNTAFRKVSRFSLAVNKALANK